jgi:hypothetical protein
MFGTPSQTLDYYDLIVEVDIISFMGIILAAHSRSWNPLTWIGVSEWMWRNVLYPIGYKVFYKIDFFRSLKCFRSLRLNVFNRSDRFWSGRWHGTFEAYIRKAINANIRYVAVELKDGNINALEKALFVADHHPEIMFLFIYDSLHLSMSYIEQVDEILKYGYRPNVVQYVDFEKTNKITNMDFYQ